MAKRMRRLYSHYNYYYRYYYCYRNLKLNRWYREENERRKRRKRTTEETHTHTHSSIIAFRGLRGRQTTNTCQVVMQVWVIPNTTHAQLEYDTNEWFWWRLRWSSRNHRTDQIFVLRAHARTHIIHRCIQFANLHQRMCMWARAYLYDMNSHLIYILTVVHNIIWTPNTIFIWKCVCMSGGAFDVTF